MVIEPAPTSYAQTSPSQKVSQPMWIMGIDIAKAEHAVRVQNETGSFREGSFANNEKGFKALKKWLKPIKLDEVRVCLEATNIYWEEIAEYLQNQGAKVSVVNPMRTKGFAQSQMRRNKTDKVDAHVIADFCAANPDLTVWQPPTLEQRKLRALVRHRTTLIKTRTQQSNRLKTCREPEIHSSLTIVIATLNDQIDQISQQITALIKQSPKLKEDSELLCSIKGIGATTAEHILAELYDLATYESARSAAADAGLTPAHHESGSSVKRRPKLSKVGKASVRGALFFPTLSAMRSNPIIHAFTQRLEKRGKLPMVIIGASMRKLLHIAYGVLKHRTPFDPNYLEASPA